MSRITDAIDHVEVEVPKPPDTAVVASDADLRDAAIRGLGARDLAAAALGGFGDLPVEVLGFSARTAEPFRCEGVASALLPRLRACLEGRADADDRVDDLLWGQHRGHAVFLAPTVEGARACLALRLAESLDASHALRNHLPRIAAAVRGLASVDELASALADDAVTAVCDAILGAPDGPPAAASTAIRPDPARELGVVDGHGNAVLVRGAATAGPLALVERGGRPFALALGVGDVASLLAFLHALVDLDAPAAEVFPAGGVRVEAGRAPETAGDAAVLTTV